jgi:hypothetical protein
MRLSLFASLLVFPLSVPFVEASAQGQHWIDTAIQANGGCGPHRQLFDTGLSVIRAQQQTRRNMSPALFGKPAGEWSDDDLAYAMDAYEACEARLYNTTPDQIRTQPVHKSMAGRIRRDIGEIIETARTTVRTQQAQIQAQRVDADRQANEAVERAGRNQALAEQLMAQAEAEERRFNETKKLADASEQKLKEAQERLATIKRQREAEERRIAETAAAAQQADEQSRQVAALPAPSAPTVSQTQPPSPPGSCNPTMEQYQRLRTGAPYSQVRNILGCDGTELNQNQIGGIKTVMYQWSAGVFGGNIQVIFQNNRLMSKAQFGLE